MQWNQCQGRRTEWQRFPHQIKGKDSVCETLHTISFRQQSCLCPLCVTGLHQLSGRAGEGQEGRAVPPGWQCPRSQAVSLPRGVLWVAVRHYGCRVFWPASFTCPCPFFFFVRKTLKPPADQYTSFWLILTDKDTDILYNVKIRKYLFSLLLIIIASLLTLLT